MKDQQKNGVDKLFTFGERELNECLKQSGKKKFPFMNNSKMKKLSAFHKIVSQKRSTQLQNKQGTDEQNQYQRQGTRKSEIRKFVQLVAASQQNIQNRNMNARDSQSNKKQKKLSLPKVFKDTFSTGKRDMTRKKFISSQKSVRYKEDDQKAVTVRPFASQEIEKPRFGLYSDSRPQSLFLLSSMVSQLPEKRMKSMMQNEGGRRYRRPTKSKSTLGSEIVTLDPQISQNIRKLKRIYH